MTWKESVTKAIQRLTARTQKQIFTRQELIDSELARIIGEAGSTGQTPEQTLSRILQELRDEGTIAFEEPGVYRLLGHKTLFEIPISEIAPNPHNPRLFWDDADLDELKGSMQKVGILVPLTVYRNSRPFPKTQYVLLDGERRWRCAKQLNWNTIKANVIDEPEDVTQNILYMFNIHHYRREWELFPTALKLEQLFQALGTDQESTIFKHTGVSRQMIRRCKTLLWFPHKYRNVLMARNGKISTDFFIEIYPIARRLSKEDEFTFPEGIEKLTDGLIAKFLDGKTIKDVKDFRDIRRALAFYEEKHNFGEFKKQLAAFLETPNADLSLFTVDMQEEQNIAALMRHSAIVVDILSHSTANAFADVYVIDQLKRLFENIRNVLDEIE